MINPQHKRLLGLTLKYQRKYPEIPGSKRDMGRISLEGRKKFTHEAIGLFVKEHFVKHTLLDPMQTNEQKAHLLAQHYLEKHKGNAQKAIEEVTALHQLMGSIAAKDSALSTPRLRQLKHVRDLSEVPMDTYVIDTKHMAKTPIFQAAWVIDATIDRLRQHT